MSAWKNLIRLVVFAAAITGAYLAALFYYTLFSRTELAEAAGIGAHSQGSHPTPEKALSFFGRCG